MKKLNWKQKNRLLLVGGLLLLWLMYSFAIRNTLNAYSECAALRQSVDSASDAPARLGALQEELAQLETLTGNSKDSGAAVHEQLLGIVTGYCQQHNLTLRDFPSPVRYHQQEWLVETHPVKVEGNFIALLGLVYHLEKQKEGKVVSVNFASKKDNKTQALSLTATIYVQNIIREKT